MKRFLALLVARNLEFFRDMGTFFWSLLLPVFLIFGFAFAFSDSNRIAYKIGTFGKPAASAEFLGFKHLQFIPYDSREVALDKLVHHQVDMLLDFSAGKYYVNTDDANGYILEKMIASDSTNRLTGQTVTGKNIRYVDWFVPGVLGMNIMFSCLMGVGYVIVRYRKNGVLKRFLATPVRSIEFVSAQLVSWFLIVAFLSAAIYIGTDLILHFKMEGSYLDLAIVTALAILCHISLGLVFAARLKSEELAGGLINIVLWPMMILTGIFFSLEGTPPVMQATSRVFPITHFIEASRKIMLDGANLAAVADNVLVLAVMTIVFLAVSAIIFKWE